MKAILQSEATECGLASIAMIADFHGKRIGLSEIRRRYPLSLKGAKLGQLIHIGQQLGLSSRPLRLEMEHLSQLKPACILHWDLNHYVVLAKVDEQRIEEAARMAAVHDDIAGMAMGYHGLIGGMGNSLSGGQKQRVILARALYRRPRILFLDEATSHLDVMRERLVNEAVQRMELTKVIVAHRPETINSADRVLVMEQGRIVQEVRPQREASTAPASDAEECVAASV
ncbi:cysteine peptidase family C39 domain-containing protein [Stenotrophomonas sp. A3_2]|uniref:cysteine peptidase family C39 domain-containing protein n=1 Tax=Stenotrophomonas sp. A3_2 TaxID=3119978 RepID=UPI002FC2765C